MKMPWYSAYSEADSRPTRYRPRTATHHNVTVNVTTSSYSSPSFRHSMRNSSPGSPRRSSFQFNYHRPTVPERSSAYKSRFGEQPSHQREWTSPGTGPGASRRHWDAATERLFARADALTERLQRLLAKSADLRWRTTSTTTVPGRSADARPDIYSSRVSQTRTETDPGSPRRAAKTAPVHVEREDWVSRAERPAPRTHVITIKLSNGYANRAGSSQRYTRRTSSDLARKAAERAREVPDEPPSPPAPATPPPPPTPPAPGRHRTTFVHPNLNYRAKEEPASPAEHEEDEEPRVHRSHFWHGSSNQRYYARASSGPKKTPVVRIIPILVEADDDGPLTAGRARRIDPERDIQEPDCEPIVTSPAPSKSSSITLEIPSRLVVEELDDESEAAPNGVFTSRADDSEQETTADPTPSRHPASRREVLTLRLAEEKKDEGNLYYRQRNYTSAHRCYTRAIELCPTNVTYYGNRSACRLMLNMYQHALEDARESVRLDPGFTKGYVRIAKSCLALGDAAAALNAINKAEELEPSTDLAEEKRSLRTLQQHIEDMDFSYAKGDYRRVIYCCDRALEFAPASRRIKLCKAECLALLGRYQEAEELANDILRLDQNNPDALLVRGLCLYYQDNIDKAFAHFKQVLVMAPDHVKARDAFKKARTLKTKKEEGNEAFKAGRFQEALDLYTETLSIDPNNRLTNAKVYFNRAVVLVKLGKLTDAVTDCDKAIELDESYVKAYLRRAKIFMDLEQYEDAIRDYEKVNKMEKNKEYKRLLHEAKVALKRSQRKDYYKILGVDRNANDDEIKKAYKKRALVHHPDRHSSATEEEKKEQEKKFKELGEAYGILSDPKKKSRYDNGHDLDDMGYSGDMDPNQIFQAFFGGGPGMFRTGGMGGMGGGHCPGGFSFQFG